MTHGRWLKPLVAVVGLLLAGGSGAYLGTDARPVATEHGPGHGMSHHGTAHRGTTAGAPAPFRTVEQLAVSVGCAPKISLKGADFRQATCIDVVLLDFATAEGQRAWLDAAQPYGGVYLVGDRWALSGNSAERIETLQAALGGTIEHQG